MLRKKNMEAELLYAEIGRLKKENHRLHLQLDVYKGKEKELEKLKTEYMSLVYDTKGLKKRIKDELHSFKKLYSEYHQYLEKFAK